MSWLYQPLIPAAADLQSAPVTYPGYVKIWMGSAWVYKPVKTWDGTQWVIKPAKWYDTATTSWITTSGT